jgi:precorrin-2 dehydrogenase/sirohydrochlorin ferrochelatase
MALPVLVGMPVGHLLLRRLPPETFRRITMSVDALLVTFSLTRAGEALGWWHPSGSLALASLIGALEAVILYRYFSPPPARELTHGKLALDFPVALRLEGRRALVVGGGKVAEGRVAHLLEARARVRVVAPEVTERIAGWAEAGALEWTRREVDAADFEGAPLVLSATDQLSVTLLAAAEAKKRGALFNAADAPELCDFFVPSIGRRGPVTVAVSTAGQAPGLARHVRARAMKSIGPGYAVLARLLGRLRRRLPKGAGRNELLQRLIDGGAAELLERRDVAGVRRLAEAPEGRS